jgi:hypothetical protein
MPGKTEKLQLCLAGRRIAEAVGSINGYHFARCTPPQGTPLMLKQQQTMRNYAKMDQTAAVNKSTMHNLQAAQSAATTPLKLYQTQYNAAR